MRQPLDTPRLAERSVRFKAERALADKEKAAVRRALVMVDANSNCSRVDAAKAAANQLSLQLAQAPQGTQKSDSYRKAQAQLQNLNQDIKSNNAQKAETALSSATSAVKQLNAQTSSTPGGFQAGLDVYA
jgi:hypothetical protein